MICCGTSSTGPGSPWLVATVASRSCGDTEYGWVPIPTNSSAIFVLAPGSSVSTGSGMRVTSGNSRASKDDNVVIVCVISGHWSCISTLYVPSVVRDGSVAE